MYLNWKDIMYIVEFADQELEKIDKKELLKMGREYYYTLVLKRFTSFKQCESQNAVKQ